MVKPKANTADWRNLDISKWNVRTFHAYFADMNRELYGMDYVPMRNYSFEQGAIKRELTKYGAATLKAAFDECFRTYKPTPQYPILTAGFAVAYRINSIIPRLLASEKRAEANVIQPEETELPEVVW